MKMSRFRHIRKTNHFNFVSCNYNYIYKIKNKFFPSKYKFDDIERFFIRYFVYHC